MLPWILVPLTDMRPWLEDAPDGGRPGPATRAGAGARSAAAVALCSGMNAASAIAVVVPVLIYILTRRGAWPRIRMLAWWVPAALLVTCSWSVPLVLLSRYGVSVVPYTESAQVTSSATSLLNIFRGTQTWVSYLVVNGLTSWPLGFQLAPEGVPILLTGALAFATGLGSAGSFGQVPSYWVSAADWLTAHAGHQAVLVEPGAPFGQYVWGSPMDDVLQALTNVDYAERNLSVIGSPGNERLLTTIDQRLAAGKGSAGLTQVLRGMGLEYVVDMRDPI